MYVKNGERYPDETNAPDFGSIQVIQFKEHGECRYLFKNADRNKLNLLTLAGDGSLAYCTDGKYTLIKHNDEWLEV